MFIQEHKQSTTCAAAAALGAQMHTVPQFGLLLSCSVCLGDWARIAVTAGLTVVGRVGWVGMGIRWDGMGVLFVKGSPAAGPFSTTQQI